MNAPTLGSEPGGLQGAKAVGISLSAGGEETQAQTIPNPVEPAFSSSSWAELCSVL